jgi:hypothetical protein
MADSDRSQPPDSVKGDFARGLYSDVNSLRREIKDTAKFVDAMRKDPEIRSLDGDVGANITLAYRHLEDASMRLGKALQALDGGVSVYDRESTVGA